MRRVARILGRLLLVLAAVGAAIVVVLLPPKAAQPQPLSWSPSFPVVKGAFHIHSERSDGTGTLDEIAAAASRAGLQFIILTDHGDGTRTPDPPVYRSGVLCIDAVEVSTSDGHVVAIGVPKMPFRLAGHPRDVMEDIHRAGGFGLVAHPGSLKPELRWEEWEVAIDGLEWLNADSEWRDEFWTSLGRVLLTYPFRRAETLSTLLDRPAAVLERWDRETARRRLIGVAGADAHARLSVRSQSDPYEDRVLARLPSYEASFEAFANHVVLDRPLTGDAARDASAIVQAVAAGRVFTSVTGLGQLGGLEFGANGAGQTARMGDYIDAADGVEMTARIAAPAGTALVLFRNGEEIVREVTETLRLQVGTASAAYRLEAHLANPGRHATVPWLLTNPIYVNLRDQHATRQPTRPPVPTSREEVLPEWWRTEFSEGSQSAVATGQLRPNGAAPIEWRLHIAGGRGASQYAAIAFGSSPQFAPFDRIVFRVRGSQPLRLWGQLRAPGERGGRRWARSFFVGPEERDITLIFDEFLPVAGEGPLPRLDQLDSFLFVVDTLNTLPGTAATIAIDSIALAR